MTYLHYGSLFPLYCYVAASQQQIATVRNFIKRRQTSINLRFWKGFFLKSITLGAKEYWIEKHNELDFFRKGTNRTARTKGIWLECAGGWTGALSWNFEWRFRNLEFPITSRPTSSNWIEQIWLDGDNKENWKHENTSWRLSWGRGRRSRRRRNRGLRSRISLFIVPGQRIISVLTENWFSSTLVISVS